MRPYRKLLPGPPWTIPSFFTLGFEQGVGYYRNFCKHNPVFLGYMGIFFITLALEGGKMYNINNTDPDVLEKVKHRYTAFRREDVKYPDKDCYN